MKQQSFNDGLLSVYSVKNQAPKGNTPVEKLVWKEDLRFHRRTVGYGRFFSALQANVQIDLLLRVPYRPEISTQDVVIPTIDYEQYRIVQIQTPEDVMPPVMDLSLRRVEQKFDIKEE